MKHIITFILLLTLIFLFMYTCSNLGNKATNIYDKDAELIGKKVLIEKDTFLVIDYSFWNNTYTLSNGKIVNLKLVRENIIRK